MAETSRLKQATANIMAILTLRSSLVARNIAANVVGRAWMMFMSVAFVPVYLHLLGIESYGVIGFFATLSATFALLDLGLSATLNREVARRSAHPREMAEMSVVLRTLEIVYGGIGLAMAVVIVVMAPFIAHDWLHAQHLAPDTLVRVVQLMGVTIAFQWPTGLYGGGLIGLQRHVQNNALNIAVASLRGIGVLPILLLMPTLEAYFAWQLVVSIVGVFAMRLLLWRGLPVERLPPRFDASVLRALWQFAAGMTGISLVAIVLAQADKVVLSAIVPLSEYGHYVLAGALAAACGFLASPISTALYPRVTQLVALGNRDAVARLYHDGCSLMSLAVIPVVTTIAMFPYEVLLFWTRNPALADSAAPIARLLTIGVGVNALMIIPYELQIANGSTRLSLIANSVAAACVVPLVYFLGTRYGPVGAACVWPAVNLGYLAILLPLIHRNFLPGETRRWYLEDVGLPLLASAVTVSAARWMIPLDLSPNLGFIAALLTGGVTLTVAVAATPRARTAFRTLVRDRARRDPATAQC